ncbi:MAG: tRNA preQ1(34) S-adenosylmethionine ribosyltransferase-isomerase QueA [Candidatus Theseobacter exili]|nr:tRNA preQ1(34) S-adenosylmethionine ribosyltransferase-isomerase QueA [Candidatus Theseobacter exili]
MIDLNDYDYYLPKEKIAQIPADKREYSKLLIVNNGKTDSFRSVNFFNLSDFISSGDLIVANNTKVIPARLLGNRETGGKSEVFLLKRIEPFIWECLVKPAKKLHLCDKVYFKDHDCYAEVIEDIGPGIRIVKLFGASGENEFINAVGQMPLPPYITRNYDQNKDLQEFDKERYQTVFAKDDGAVAAPTAGLHFSDELIESLKDKGVNFAYVTLHVGAGTFKPLTEEDISKGKLHSEFFSISKEVAGLINKTIANGNNVFVVGTTTARTLESFADESGVVHPCEGNTDIFIKPPYKFKVVKNLITNFHLPRSSLLMLVSALAGKDAIMAAYKYAFENDYRFYSYGDAMLICSN